jgi:transaldolase
MLSLISRKSSVLSQLKQVNSIQVTKIVIDTADLSQIKNCSAEDATTNPSLILSAVNNPENSAIVDEVLKKYQPSPNKALLRKISDNLSVEFGSRLLNIVPGYVSTEIDPRLSFDTRKTIKRAKDIIDLYKDYKIDSKRVLIKIAATWEGIKAAKELESSGIHCNLTLVFNLYQAIACGDSGATLISPFVGRISDWHKKNKKDENLEDQGVKNLKAIYDYFKCHHYKTIVMGASFRNIQQIIQVAGCDRLTISPKLLEELEKTDREIDLKVFQSTQYVSRVPNISQKKFRWLMNQDPMATEKLSEGIRKFDQDTDALEKFIKKRLRAINTIIRYT